MTNTLKYGALAAIMAASFSSAALADSAETKGGLTVKTDDGRFEMKIGGRIHFDAFIVDNDDIPASGAFGSQTGSRELGGTAFRRTYLTLTGKAYGWKYKFEHDFAAEGGSFSGTAVTPTCTTVLAPGADPVSDTDNTATTTCTGITPAGSLSNTGASGYREMWVAAPLAGGDLMIGQFKPFRGMEELTSSNEITMIERPVTSATGIYAGRQFLMGLGYKGIAADSIGYGFAVMNLGAANTTTEGLHYGGRVYFAPMKDEGSALHFGLSASVDSEDTGSAQATPGFGYAGRRGPSQTFGSAGAGAVAGSKASFGDQTTIAAEIGANFGPVTLQAEYAQATLEDSHAVAGTPTDSDVNAYYLQGSFFVTGESKVYKMDRGAFGAPKPASDFGAVELVGRYEVIENGDQSATESPCGTGATFTSCEVTVMTVGANWYMNPNARLMLNYYMGEADRGGVGKDEPKAITLRTQFSF